MSGLTGLRRFAVPSRTARAGAGDGPNGAATDERCEMCGERVLERHAHLADTAQRSIGCACTACALLFTRPGGRYQTVPDRVRHDLETSLTEAEWAELAVPVGIAFFFINSALGRVVAGYPSPAGVTECELDLAAWDRLAAAHPLLSALTPDVEAILVVRGQPYTPDSRSAHVYLIPVDTCYSLAGALRLNWHGFDGGTEVRQILDDLLTDLRKRARQI